MYLESLNPQQREAVLYDKGPLLILAGAGSGKTKTITHRIVHLINQGINPRNILAVTFTNKAANEMRERVDHLLQNDPSLNQPVATNERPLIKTFHSLGVYILRQNFDRAGLLKRFSILDRTDSKKIIRDILKREGYDPKQHDPGKIIAIISRQKGDMITPEEYSDMINTNPMSEVVSMVWREYQKELKENNSLDFDDLLIVATDLLEKNKDIRNYYQNLWQYIHIDEYQDTNKVQYRMSKLLAEEHHNVCAVGDIDQNIYTWRGATIKNIMNFEIDYPSTKEIILEENYRSTQNILQAANDVISKNTIRRDKKLFTKNPEGQKVNIYRALDEYDEADFAVAEASRLIESGVSPDEIAFLYRANFQSRVLEEVCLRNDLPHQVIGTRFFDRKEVKDVLAYIKTAMNPSDFTSLNRIINYPPRGIGKVTILKIHDKKENELTPAVQEKVENFRNLLEKINNKIENSTPAEVVAFVIKESGMEDKLNEEGEEGIERLENIKELVSLAKKYSEGFENPMEQFLEDVSLTSDQDTLDKNKNGVKLMTVHAAKGLEFDYVFVTGLEQGLFPHERDGQKKEDQEEERRLCYVAITRARKKLYLTWSSFRTIYGSKEVNLSSEFLDDIDKELIKEDSFRGNENSSGEIKEYLIDY